MAWTTRRSSPPWPPGTTPDRIDVDFTGLDDVSAVRARPQAQDGCRAGDENRTDVADWSAQRFTSALARRFGLGLVGENPGPPDAPHTGAAAAPTPSPNNWSGRPRTPRGAA